MIQNGCYTVALCAQSVPLSGGITTLTCTSHSLWTFCPYKHLNCSKTSLYYIPIFIGLDLLCFKGKIVEYLSVQDPTFWTPPVVPFLSQVFFLWDWGWQKTQLESPSERTWPSCWPLYWTCTAPSGILDPVRATLHTLLCYSPPHSN